MVTVALGSTLASVIISTDVALAEGHLALALLIALQFGVTWTSVRWRAIGRFVKSEPALLLNGACPEDAMRRERVVGDEVLAAIRKSGGREYGDAEAVLLESDGSLTAILKR